MQPDSNDRLTPYLIGLTFLLCTASFLEGYDFFIVSLIMDLLAKDFHVPQTVVLKGVSVINMGAILGFFVIRFGDRVGRKPIFLLGIIGYGTLSILTAVSPGFHLYVGLQFLTKIFLVTEFNIAIVMVTEEYPARIRGTAVAVLEVASALGGGTAMLLSKSVIPALGWRGMYWIGGAPLLLVLPIMYYVRETGSYRARAVASGRKRDPLWHIWTTPSRKYALLSGALWFLCYLCYAGLIYHWVLFAKTERGWTAAQIGFPMFLASMIGMLGYVVSGAAMDLLGRRATGTFFFLCSAVSLVWAFTAHGALMMPSLVAAMFFIFALLPICSTYNAELFPTELRANAAGWCNFLLGRPAQVAAPFLVAVLSGVVGGIGNAVCFLAVGPLLAAVIMIKFMPETKGVRMDEVH